MTLIDVDYDPTAPVPSPATWGVVAGASAGQAQRARRAAILASIRRLLVSGGCDGVTVRGIAENSGHAVQTIYNLVGPRETAITEAIREYSAYVGMNFFDTRNPEATADMVEHQMRSITQNPEFCRAVCMIYFSGFRNIYYSFRNSQIKHLHVLLRRQQKLGILRANVDLHDIATQLMVYNGALCIEWADNCLSTEDLSQRLYLGYYNILTGAIDANGEALRFALATRSSTNVC